MSVNLSPTFPLTPNASGNSSGTSFPAVLKTANTAMDGTGTQVTVYTAGANGGFVQRIHLRALGSNAQSVARLFLNNGATAGTASNNQLIEEVTLPATTASANSATNPVDIPLNIEIPAGYVLNMTIGTTVSAGYAIVAYGKDY